MKIGMIGLGHVHADGYLSRMKKILDVELVGIAEENSKQREFMCAKYGTRGFADWNELLDAQPDAVFVTNENSKHLSPASDAIKRGIPVLCEKPLGVDEQEMLDFVELVEKSKVRCMTLLPNRFAAPIIEAKAAIDAGTIGKVLSIHATNYGKMPGGFFVEPELSGGGSLVDHTIHVGDITNWIAGVGPEEVWGIARTKIFPDLKVDDISQVHYRYADGMTVTLDSSWSRHECYPSERNLTMTIFGEKGSIFVDLTRDRQELFAHENGGWKLGIEDKVTKMLEAAVDCLRNGAEFPVSARDGYLASRMALMAYKNLWGK